jgi:phage terminase large subunit
MEEKINHTKKKEFGFRTDLRTRPSIISYLVELIRDHTELINDADTLREMLHFIFNEEGRAEAQQGCHDDLVMGLAIAYRIIQQISYIADTIQVSNTMYNQRQQDEGERIVVI